MDKLTGRFLRVAETSSRGLQPNEAIIEFWEKDPNVPAFTELLNRAIDKPAAHVTVAGDPEKPMSIQWMTPE